VIEEVYVTAPDGPMVADVSLSGAWTAVVVALGAGIIALGGALVSHSASDRCAVRQATPTTWSQQWRR
jgi:hypothetical protein